MRIAELIYPVACELWGIPNARLSNGRELRWGDHGGRMVRLDQGVWADHAGEHSTINSGGVLDLVARETGLDRRGAFGWLKDHGFEVDESSSAPERRNGYDQSTPDKDKPMLGKEVAAYDYVDENGALLFQVVRYEPKTFRQRRRDEVGNWTSSVRGVRQVPYRLPELIEALAMGHPTLVVEGERDVDNLRALGIPATSNAGGAGKWRPELCPFFKDADVIVLQDNDPQAKTLDGSLRFHADGRPVLPGQDHAQDVAKQLSAVAARVRVVDLSKHWPDMPPKADISDWLVAGGTAEKLYEIVEKTPDWTANPYRSRFGAKRWEEIGADNADGHYPWLVEDVIPLGDISMAFGDSGTGKSFDMFDMAMCVARGIKFNGRNVEQGLVVYVAAEAGKGFTKRKVAYVIHNGLQGAEQLPFVLLTKRPNIFQDDVDALALIEEIDAIAASYKGLHKLVLIVIDTMSAITQGMDEISGRDQSVVRKRLMMLQEKSNAAVVVVHHKPKNGSSPRGHGSITADIETTIEFETITDKKTDSGKVIHRATARKQREGKAGIFWEFTLRMIEVGRNKWGNPENSCVVVPYGVGTPKAPIVGFQANATERLFLRALFDALSEHGQEPPSALPKTIKKVVESRHIRALMRERYIAPHEDNSVTDNRFRGAFKRAGDALRDGAVIGVQGELYWWTGKIVRGFDVGGAT